MLFVTPDVVRFRLLLDNSRATNSAFALLVPANILPLGASLLGKSFSIIVSASLLILQPPKVPLLIFLLRFLVNSNKSTRGRLPLFIATNVFPLGVLLNRDNASGRGFPLLIPANVLPLCPRLFRTPTALFPFSRRPRSLSSPLFGLGRLSGTLNTPKIRVYVAASARPSPTADAWSRKSGLERLNALCPCLCLRIRSV